jgi:hypothetical protein
MIPWKDINGLAVMGGNEKKSSVFKGRVFQRDLLYSQTVRDMRIILRRANIRDM